MYENSNKNNISIKAPAKINLGLDVTGRRENGYHDVRMIMQSIDLCDDVEIRKTESGLTMDLVTEGVDRAFLTADKDNLCYKAAEAMMKKYGIESGVHVKLTKRIPVAAGMAGGSTDAAAVIIGINRLFSIGASEQELMDLGVTLGADIPFCIMKGTALSEGIGEILTPVAPLPECRILIGKPECGVSTKEVYEALDALMDEGKAHHPDIDAILRGLRSGDLYETASCFGNILQDVTVPKHPEIENIKDIMKEHGAVNAMMSGSGPTVFGIFDDDNKLSEALRALKESGLAKDVIETKVYEEKNDR